MCICTFNRANSLARVLNSLAAQERIQGLSWELLVVDNHSTDQTRLVSDQYKSTLPLRYLFEAEQGLSAARNRALAEFTGGILIFTDDDVVLDTLWLSSYASAVNSFPQATYFGGRILPLWLDRKPDWLVDPTLALISGLLVYYDLGEMNRWLLPSDPSPFGANFALMRDLTESLQPFQTELGVKGDCSGRGEETEYLRRAVAFGARGAYVGQASCFHVQNIKRLNLRYIYNYGIESGKAEYLLGRGGSGSGFDEAMFYAKGLFQLMKGRGDRFRQCLINAGIQRGLRSSRYIAKTK